MLKGISVLLLLVASPLFGYPPLPEPRNGEEELLIRRIVDLWRDQEYPFAEAQIKSYLKNTPKTPYTDHFFAMLGDIALKNKDFREAIAYYEKAGGDDIKKYVRLKKWQALYHLASYAELYQEIAPFVDELDDEGRFYFADSAFREALALYPLAEEKEVAQALFAQALPLFAALTKNSAFALHAKLAMAQIFRQLDRQEEAAALFAELAEQEEDKEVLFHAASMLLQWDKARAAKIFKQLAREGGAKAQEAAFQWLLILAEAADWETIAYERDLFTKGMLKEHIPLGFFYVGMVNFDKKQFAQAYLDLKKCVGQNLPAQNEKRAYFALIASAGELKEWEPCELFFDTLCTQFPESSGEASSLLASAYQKAGELILALKLFHRVTQEFPCSAFAEKAFVEKIRIYMGQKKFAEAHATLQEYLAAFPHSEKRTDFFRLAIDLSVAQLAEKEVYSQLAADLERGLQAKLFYREEKREKELLLAKSYLKLGNVEGALQLLESHSDPDPLLLAYGYIKKGGCVEKIVEYGEKALLLYPDETPLHLHLFNAYLELAQGDFSQGYIKKGAAHLAQAVDKVPISQENRLWLARHFSKKNPEKALPLLASLFQSEDNLRKFSKEALLLANLYARQDRLEEAEKLLAQITGLNLTCQSEAQLKLAGIYLKKGEPEKARPLLHKLEDSAQLAVAYGAKLEMARLEFAAAPDKALSKLQELAERKNLAYEPIHLEAALDYADLKASTYPESERAIKHLELLEEMKARFSHRSDILSKDYHANRQLFPEKDLVYLAYMRYLDARIYQLQALIGADPVEGKTKINAAKALFSTLRSGKYSVSPYLKEKAAVWLYE